MEMWRDIRGYEGYYQVSNEGRVRSLDRYVMRKNGIPQTIKKRILEVYDKGNGHLQVHLKKNGVRKHKQVHILVAEAFIPNPDPTKYTIVHHIDHDPTNNRVENLIWMSDEEHRGMHVKERCSKRVDQIDKVTGEVLHQWYSAHEAANKLGIKNGFVSISACARCEKGYKTYKGSIWNYPIIEKSSLS